MRRILVVFLAAAMALVPTAALAESLPEIKMEAPKLPEMEAPKLPPMEVPTLEGSTSSGGTLSSGSSSSSSTEEPKKETSTSGTSSSGSSSSGSSSTSGDTSGGTSGTSSSGSSSTSSGSSSPSPSGETMTYPDWYNGPTMELQDQGEVKLDQWQMPSLGSMPEVQLSPLPELQVGQLQPYSLGEMSGLQMPGTLSGPNVQMPSMGGLSSLSPQESFNNSTGGGYWAPFVGGSGLGVQMPSAPQVAQVAPPTHPSWLNAWLNEGWVPEVEGYEAPPELVAPQAQISSEGWNFPWGWILIGLLALFIVAAIWVILRGRDDETVYLEDDEVDEVTASPSSNGSDKLVTPTPENTPSSLDEELEQLVNSR